VQVAQHEISLKICHALALWKQHIPIRRREQKEGAENGATWIAGCIPWALQTARTLSMDQRKSRSQALFQHQAQSGYPPSRSI